MRISFLFVLCILVSICYGQSSKINGMSLVAPPFAPSGETYQNIKDVNASWISVHPSAYLKKGEATLLYDSNFQFWGERKEGVIHCITEAKKKGLKVMVKPQIWMHNYFIGDVSFSANPMLGKIFEVQYKKFILDFAKIADSLDADIFSIGCEMKLIATNRPNYFKALIKSIKNVFSGKLTYAANWDNYDKITFWNDLDFIGIDAYFPLSNAKSPGIQELKTAWLQYSIKFKQLSERFNKQILFAEYGYRNADYNCKEVWRYDTRYPNNENAQSTAFKALYQSIWQSKWMAGGFIWEWESDYIKKQPDNTDFTPQFKKAEDIIRHYYGL